MSQVQPLDVRARGARRRQWIVGGLVGAGVGFVVLLVALPLLLVVLLTSVGPLLGEDLAERSGRVSVAADGSVSGVALARSLALLGHEGVTCPDVTRATTDTMVLCRAAEPDDDRVAVAFDDGQGRFTTAVLTSD